MHTHRSNVAPEKSIPPGTHHARARFQPVPGNDQVIHLHPCTGVTTPTIPKRPLHILTPEEFNRIVNALPMPRWQLLAELAVESGLRWGELAELRVNDLHQATRVLTVSRTVVELHTSDPDGQRYFVKHYPKNSEYRQLHLSDTLTTDIINHTLAHDLADQDLLFAFPHAEGDTTTPHHPTTPVDEAPEGHGTMRRYHQGCHCPYCRRAYAQYQHHRRAQGKDRPPQGRHRSTDGHLPRDWFRKQIWYPAITDAGIGRNVRIHDLRHTNASWMLAGGADLETVRERLGHKSLRATERYLHTLPNTGDKALTALHRIRTPE